MSKEQKPTDTSHIKTAVDASRNFKAQKDPKEFDYSKFSTSYGLNVTQTEQDGFVSECDQVGAPHYKYDHSSEDFQEVKEGQSRATTDKVVSNAPPKQPAE